MDAMKKIYLFTANYPFSHGEHLLEYETQYLSKEFDSVTIICSDTSTPFQGYKISENIDVVRKSFRLNSSQKKFILLNFLSPRFWVELYTIIFIYKKWPNLSIIYSILYSIKQAQVVQDFLEKEIIHKDKSSKLFFYSWWTFPLTLGMVFTKIKNPQIKVITRARAVDLYFERHRNNYLPFRKFMYSIMDKTFCISEDGKKYIEEKLNNNQTNDNIIISRVGCVNRYKYSAITHINDTKIVVSCSNIIPLKRIELIIEALSYIDEIKINWIHFGEGEEKENLLLLSNNLLSEKKNISYSFHGYIKNRKLLEYYNSNYVDLFVNVSEYEGIPVTLMEAMSFGIPTVATDVGGVKELVNNKNGYLMKKDLSPKELSEVLIEYLKLPLENQKNYRNNARKSWEENYNSDFNFEKLAKTISAL